MDEKLARALAKRARKSFDNYVNPDMEQKSRLIDKIERRKLKKHHKRHRHSSKERRHGENVTPPTPSATDEGSRDSKGNDKAPRTINTPALDSIHEADALLDLGATVVIENLEEHEKQPCEQAFDSMMLHLTNSSTSEAMPSTTAITTASSPQQTSKGDSTEKCNESPLRKSSSAKQMTSLALKPSSVSSEPVRKGSGSSNSIPSIESVRKSSGSSNGQKPKRPPQSKEPYVLLTKLSPSQVSAAKGPSNSSTSSSPSSSAGQGCCPQLHVPGVLCADCGCLGQTVASSLKATGATDSTSPIAIPSSQSLISDERKNSVISKGPDFVEQLATAVSSFPSASASSPSAQKDVEANSAPVSESAVASSQGRAAPSLPLTCPADGSISRSAVVPKEPSQSFSQSVPSERQPHEAKEGSLSSGITQNPLFKKKSCIRSSQEASEIATNSGTPAKSSQGIDDRQQQPQQQQQQQQADSAKVNDKSLSGAATDEIRMRSVGQGPQPVNQGQAEAKMGPPKEANLTREQPAGVQNNNQEKPSRDLAKESFPNGDKQKQQEVHKRNIAKGDRPHITECIESVLLSNANAAANKTIYNSEVRVNKSSTLEKHKELKRKQGIVHWKSAGNLSFQGSKGQGTTAANERRIDTKTAGNLPTYSSASKLPSIPKLRMPEIPARIVANSNKKLSSSSLPEKQSSPLERSHQQKKSAASATTTPLYPIVPRSITKAMSSTFMGGSSPNISRTTTDKQSDRTDKPKASNAQQRATASGISNSFANNAAKQRSVSFDRSGNTYDPRLISTAINTIHAIERTKSTSNMPATASFNSARPNTSGHLNPALHSSAKLGAPMTQKSVDNSNIPAVSTNAAPGVRRAVSVEGLQKSMTASSPVNASMRPANLATSATTAKSNSIEKSITKQPIGAIVTSAVPAGSTTAVATATSNKPNDSNTRLSHFSASIDLVCSQLHQEARPVNSKSTVIKAPQASSSNFVVKETLATSQATKGTQQQQASTNKPPLPFSQPSPREAKTSSTFQNSAETAFKAGSSLSTFTKALRDSSISLAGCASSSQLPLDLRKISNPKETNADRAEQALASKPTGLSDNSVPAKQPSLAGRSDQADLPSRTPQARNNSPVPKPTTTQVKTSFSQAKCSTASSPRGNAPASQTVIAKTPEVSESGKQQKVPPPRQRLNSDQIIIAQAEKSRRRPRDVSSIYSDESEEGEVSDSGSESSQELTTKTIHLRPRRASIRSGQSSSASSSRDTSAKRAGEAGGPVTRSSLPPPGRTGGKGPAEKESGTSRTKSSQARPSPGPSKTASVKPIAKRRLSDGKPLIEPAVSSSKEVENQKKGAISQEDVIYDLTQDSGTSLEEISERQERLERKSSLETKRHKFSTDSSDIPLSVLRQQAGPSTAGGGGFGGGYLQSIEAEQVETVLANITLTPSDFKPVAKILPFSASKDSEMPKKPTATVSPPSATFSQPVATSVIACTQTATCSVITSPAALTLSASKPPFVLSNVFDNAKQMLQQEKPIDPIIPTSVLLQSQTVVASTASPRMTAANDREESIHQRKRLHQHRPVNASLHESTPIPHSNISPGSARSGSTNSAHFQHPHVISSTPIVPSAISPLEEAMVSAELPVARHQRQPQQDAFSLTKASRSSQLNFEPPPPPQAPPSNPVEPQQRAFVVANTESFSMTSVHNTVSDTLASRDEAVSELTNQQQQQQQEQQANVTSNGRIVAVVNATAAPTASQALQQQQQQLRYQPGQSQFSQLEATTTESWLLATAAANNARYGRFETELRQPALASATHTNETGGFETDEDFSLSVSMSIIGEHANKAKAADAYHAAELSHSFGVVGASSRKVSCPPTTCIASAMTADQQQLALQAQSMVSDASSNVYSGIAAYYQAAATTIANASETGSHSLYQPQTAFGSQFGGGGAFQPPSQQQQSQRPQPTEVQDTSINYNAASAPGYGNYSDATAYGYGYNPAGNASSAQGNAAGGFRSQIGAPIAQQPAQYGRHLHPKPGSQHYSPYGQYQAPTTARGGDFYVEGSSYHQQQPYHAGHGYGPGGEGPYSRQSGPGYGSAFGYPGGPSGRRERNSLGSREPYSNPYYTQEPHTHQPFNYESALYEPATAARSNRLEPPWSSNYAAESYGSMRGGGRFMSESANDRYCQPPQPRKGSHGQQPNYRYDRLGEPQPLIRPGRAYGRGQTQQAPSWIPPAAQAGSSGTYRMAPEAHLLQQQQQQHGTEIPQMDPWPQQSYGGQRQQAVTASSRFPDINSRAQQQQPHSHGHLQASHSFAGGSNYGYGDTDITNASKYPTGSGNLGSAANPVSGYGDSFAYEPITQAVVNYAAEAYGVAGQLQQQFSHSSQQPAASVKQPAQASPNTKAPTKRQRRQPAPKTPPPFPLAEVPPPPPPPLPPPPPPPPSHGFSHHPQQQQHYHGYATKPTEPVLLGFDYGSASESNFFSEPLTVQTSEASNSNTEAVVAQKVHEILALHQAELSRAAAAEGSSTSQISPKQKTPSPVRSRRKSNKASRAELEFADAPALSIAADSGGSPRATSSMDFEDGMPKLIQSCPSSPQGDALSLSTDSFKSIRTVPLLGDISPAPLLSIVTPVPPETSMSPILSEPQNFSNAEVNRTPSVSPGIAEEGRKRSNTCSGLPTEVQPPFSLEPIPSIVRKFSCLPSFEATNAACNSKDEDNQSPTIKALFNLAVEANQFQSQLNASSDSGSIQGDGSLDQNRWQIAQADQPLTTEASENEASTNNEVAAMPEGDSSFALETPATETASDSMACGVEPANSFEDKAEPETSVVEDETESSQCFAQTALDELRSEESAAVCTYDESGEAEPDDLAEEDEPLNEEAPSNEESLDQPLIADDIEDASGGTIVQDEDPNATDAVFFFSPRDVLRDVAARFHFDSTAQEMAACEETINETELLENELPPANEQLVETDAVLEDEAAPETPADLLVASAIGDSDNNSRAYSRASFIVVDEINSNSMEPAAESIETYSRTQFDSSDQLVSEPDADGRRFETEPISESEDEDRSEQQIPATEAADLSEKPSQRLDDEENLAEVKESLVAECAVFPAAAAEVSKAHDVPVATIDSSITNTSKSMADAASSEPIGMDEEDSGIFINDASKEPIEEVSQIESPLQNWTTDVSPNLQNSGEELPPTPAYIASQAFPQLAPVQEPMAPTLASPEPKDETMEAVAESPAAADSQTHISSEEVYHAHDRVIVSQTNSRKHSIEAAASTGLESEASESDEEADGSEEQLEPQQDETEWLFEKSEGSATATIAESAAGGAQRKRSLVSMLPRAPVVVPISADRSQFAETTVDEEATEETKREARASDGKTNTAAGINEPIASEVPVAQDSHQFERDGLHLICEAVEELHRARELAKQQTVSVEETAEDPLFEESDPDNIPETGQEEEAEEEDQAPDEFAEDQQSEPDEMMIAVPDHESLTNQATAVININLRYQKKLSLPNFTSDGASSSIDENLRECSRKISAHLLLAPTGDVLTHHLSGSDAETQAAVNALLADNPNSNANSPFPPRRPPIISSVPDSIRSVTSPEAESTTTTHRESLADSAPSAAKPQQTSVIHDQRKLSSQDEEQQALRMQQGCYSVLVPPGEAHNAAMLRRHTMMPMMMPEKKMLGSTMLPIASCAAADDTAMRFLGRPMGGFPPPPKRFRPNAGGGKLSGHPPPNKIPRLNPNTTSNAAPSAYSTAFATSGVLSGNFHAGGPQLGGGGKPGAGNNRRTNSTGTPAQVNGGVGHKSSVGANIPPVNIEVSVVGSPYIYGSEANEDQNDGLADRAEDERVIEKHVVTRIPKIVSTESLAPGVEGVRRPTSAGTPPPPSSSAEKSAFSLVRDPKERRSILQGKTSTASSQHQPLHNFLAVDTHSMMLPSGVPPISPAMASSQQQTPNERPDSNKSDGSATSKTSAGEQSKIRHGQLQIGLPSGGKGGSRKLSPNISYASSGTASDIVANAMTSAMSAEYQASAAQHNGDDRFNHSPDTSSISTESPDANNASQTSSHRRSSFTTGNFSQPPKKRFLQHRSDSSEHPHDQDTPPCTSASSENSEQRPSSRHSGITSLPAANGGGSHPDAAEFDRRQQQQTPPRYKYSAAGSVGTVTSEGRDGSPASSINITRVSPVVSSQQAFNALEAAAASQHHQRMLQQHHQQQQQLQQQQQQQRRGSRSRSPSTDAHIASIVERESAAALQALRVSPRGQTLPISSVLRHAAQTSVLQHHQASDAAEAAASKAAEASHAAFLKSQARMSSALHESAASGQQSQRHLPFSGMTGLQLPSGLNRAEPQSPDFSSLLAAQQHQQQQQAAAISMATAAVAAKQSQQQQQQQLAQHHLYENLLLNESAAAAAAAGSGGFPHSGQPLSMRFPHSGLQMPSALRWPAPAGGAGGAAAKNGLPTTPTTASGPAGFSPAVSAAVAAAQHQQHLAMQQQTSQAQHGPSHSAAVSQQYLVLQETRNLPQGECFHLALANWEWYTLDGTRLPCVFRNREKFLAVHMVQMRVLAKFPPNVPPEIMASHRMVSHKMTVLEAWIFNTVNASQCKYEFGYQLFVPGDEVVNALDVEKFYHAVKAFNLQRIIRIYRDEIRQNADLHLVLTAHISSLKHQSETELKVTERAQIALGSIPPGLSSVTPPNNILPSAAVANGFHPHSSTASAAAAAAAESLMGAAAAAGGGQGFGGIRQSPGGGGLSSVIQKGMGNLCSPLGGGFGAAAAQSLEQLRHQQQQQQDQGSKAASAAAAMSAAGMGGLMPGALYHHQYHPPGGGGGGGPSSAAAASAASAAAVYQQMAAQHQLSALDGLSSQNADAVIQMAAMAAANEAGGRGGGAAAMHQYASHNSAFLDMATAARYAAANSGAHLMGNLQHGPMGNMRL